MLGLEIDEPIEGVIARLSKKGVKLGPIVRDSPGAFVHFEDPDGNEIYLWEVNRAAIPETKLVGAVQR
jgi:predicted enzyme related to lactoylglutathione lyase